MFCIRDKNNRKNLLLQDCQAGISTSGNISAGDKQLLIQGMMHFPKKTQCPDFFFS